jgi:hypothetical protein
VSHAAAPVTTLAAFAQGVFWGAVYRCCCCLLLFAHHFVADHFSPLSVGQLPCKLLGSFLPSGDKLCRCACQKQGDGGEEGSTCVGVRAGQCSTRPSGRGRRGQGDTFRGGEQQSARRPEIPAIKHMPTCTDTDTPCTHTEMQTPPPHL